MINEKTMNGVMSLTEYQKAVLVKVFSAPTKKVAGDEVSTSKQLSFARDILNKTGLIAINTQTGEISITDNGTSVMKNSGLLDDIGNITLVGKKYLSLGASSPETKDQVDKSFESFGLIREINNLIKG